MEITKQVCTLKQAKRLKELGVTGSYFHHFKGGVYAEAYGNDYHPAFTVAELGVMLPEYYESHRGPIDKTWYAGKLEMYNTDEWFAIEATEAQAKAAMLIYLLENNLTTAAEVNERLRSA